MKKVLVSIVLIMALALTPSILDAKTGRDHNSAMKGLKRLKIAERMLFSAKGILRHKDSLGLTDKQESALRKMSEKYYEYEVRQKAEVKIAKMKLQSYLREDRIDRARVASKVKKISGMMAEMQIERINHRLDVKKTLTKDQLKKIEELRKTRRKRMFKKQYMMKRERETREKARMKYRKNV